MDKLENLERKMLESQEKTKRYAQQIRKEKLKRKRQEQHMKKNVCNAIGEIILDESKVDWRAIDFDLIKLWVETQVSTEEFRSCFENEETTIDEVATRLPQKAAGTRRRKKEVNSDNSQSDEGWELCPTR